MGLYSLFCFNLNTQRLPAKYPHPLSVLSPEAITGVFRVSRMGPLEASGASSWCLLGKLLLFRMGPVSLKSFQQAPLTASLPLSPDPHLIKWARSLCEVGIVIPVL